jgi:PAS domain S-box-containing protein
MPLACVFFDTAGRILEWNPAAERIFGYARSEIIGRSAFETIVPESARAGVEEKLWLVRAGDMAANNVNENRTKDGRTILCEWYNTPFPNAAGEVIGCLSLAQDITEKHSLEQQLRQAQKMDAIGQLAAGVAHDFNNLLTIINGYSGLLLEGMPPEHPNFEFLNEILSAGERSASLTRQLLVFSRQQVVTPKVLDLNAVVADTEKLLRRVIGEDVRLATSLGVGLGRVLADEGQLQQVLLNLAVNARDAMPRGGRLTIKTRNVELDENRHRTDAPGAPRPEVLLTVSDTGCGMTEEVKARIFEPFFTTKEVGKGTGLGLAVVHGIVKHAEGRIEVESQVGVGTTFKVYLPRVDQPAGHAKPPSGIRPPPRGTETVLLVEDEDGVRLLTRHALAGCGYKVLDAGDGEEGLLLASRHDGPIHLLVTDVIMPGLGGLQVAERALALHPKLKVLFVSGYTDDAVMRQGVLAEQVHFLQKPFSPVALAFKVREVLDEPPRRDSPPS